MRYRSPRLLLALLLAAAPRFVAAEGARLGPDRIYLPLASHHTMSPGTFGLTAWEKVNPGLILSWEDRGPGGQFDLGVGLVRNSLGIVSPTVSVGLIRAISEDLDLGVTGSFVYYGGDGDLFDGHIGGGVFLVPALQARYKSAFAQLIPSKGGVVGLFGLTFPLGTR